MLYFVYFLIACAVIWCSVKTSQCVDALEKKTALSGAFIGGVVLSAVTSLPELFTSISSALLLDKPGLAIGNILGSNLFNYAMLSCFIAVSYKSFIASKQAASHVTVVAASAGVYAVMLLNMGGLVTFEFHSLSVTSAVIVLLYAYGVFYLAKDNGAESLPTDEMDEGLSLKELKKRIALLSLGIIATSVILTYVTDSIAVRLGLGEGIAGALFLGIATSLPEAASTFALFRLKSYDIAVGNIVGSNIFNFLILAVTDAVYTGKGVYDFSDPKSANLLIFGAVANLIFLRLIWKKETRWRVVTPYMIILCYVLFLIV